MNIDLILLVAFGLILLAIMLCKKKNVELQKILFPVVYFVLYRTRIGLNFMDKFAKKYPKLLKVLSYVSIVFGFGGMLFILYFLIKGAVEFLVQHKPSPVQLLLPGVATVPGLPKISFFHWIIAIFILATVHEFSHGIFSRFSKIKVKSSGFAIFGLILPILPAAFVEPDEKQLNKAKVKSQLAVLSAGSFANIITAGVVFLIFALVLTPIAASTITVTGVQALKFEEGYPTNLSGMQPGENILMVNGINITNTTTFTQVMENVKPNETVTILTDNNTYVLTAVSNPQNSSRGYIGIYVGPAQQEFKEEYKEKYGEPLLKTLFWINILFFWLFVANLGVGLFNLLPLGPLDGGRMFFIVLKKYYKDEKKAKKIWAIVSAIFLILIIILLAPQIMNLVIDPILGIFI